MGASFEEDPSWAIGIALISVSSFCVIFTIFLLIIQCGCCKKEAEGGYLPYDERGMETGKSDYIEMTSGGVKGGSQKSGTVVNDSAYLEIGNSKIPEGALPVETPSQMDTEVEMKDKQSFVPTRSGSPKGSPKRTVGATARGAPTTLVKADGTVPPRYFDITPMGGAPTAAATSKYQSPTTRVKADATVTPRYCEIGSLVGPLATAAKSKYQTQPPAECPKMADAVMQRGQEMVRTPEQMSAVGPPTMNPKWLGPDGQRPQAGKPKTLRVGGPAGATRRDMIVQAPVDQPPMKQATMKPPQSMRPTAGIQGADIGGPPTRRRSPRSRSPPSGDRQRRHGQPASPGHRPQSPDRDRHMGQPPSPSRRPQSLGRDHQTGRPPPPRPDQRYLPQQADAAGKKKKAAMFSRLV